MFSPAPSWAQDKDKDSDLEPDPTKTGAVDPERPEPKESKESKESKLASPIQIGGRLFVRSTFDKTIATGAEWGNVYDVSSARLNLDYRKYDWLRAGIEADFAENDLELKDVYIRARVHPGFSVTVGNVKRPISPLALSSIWDLPVIERGILSDRLLTANYRVPLNLGGRAPGIMLTYKNKASVRPEIQFGLFNATLPTRVSGGAELADQADNLLRDVYLRAQIEPIRGFSVGGTLVAFTQARFADDLRTRLFGSLDVRLDTKHFRAWLEGFAGRTPFFDGTESVGGLLALRVLAAGRLHRPTSWLRLVEPFVGFSALDPTDEKQDNQGSEISTGVTAFLRKNLRLQLDYARTLNENEFPQANFTLLDTHTIRLQLGVRIR